MSLEQGRQLDIFENTPAKIDAVEEIKGKFDLIEYYEASALATINLINEEYKGKAFARYIKSRDLHKRDMYRIIIDRIDPHSIN